MHEQHKAAGVLIRLFRALRTEPKMTVVEKLHYMVGYLQASFFPATTPSWIKKSAELGAWEYFTISRIVAIGDYDPALCQTCRQRHVKALPLTVAEWNGRQVGVCETCQRPVIRGAIDNPFVWDWKIKQAGGAHCGVIWHEPPN